MSKITVIYVSFNSGEEILGSLKTLRESGTRRDLEVIVVDNASTDGSAELLRNLEGVQLFCNESNLGYSRAVNRGIRSASGDAILILNPDVTVHDGAVDELADFLERTPKAGIVGARLLNPDGSIQHSCRAFYTMWTILLRRTPLGRLFPRSRALRRHLMLDFDHATSRTVDWILGACMMVKREAIREIGMMDERFFLYFEDVDWCYRMGRRNWEVWYHPAAEMTHVHKRSSARTPFSRSLMAHISSFIHYYEKWNPISYLLKRYRNPLKALVLIALDLMAIFLALQVATWLRVQVFAAHFDATYFDPEAYRLFTFYFFGITLTAFYLAGIYRINRRTRASEEILTLVRAESLALLILMATTYLAKESIVSRAVLLMTAPLVILLSLLVRAGLRAVHQTFLRLNFDLRRILVVGTLEEMEMVEHLSGRHPELGLDLVGRIVARETDRRETLGDLADLEEVVRQERIQEVVFAPSASGLEQLGPSLVSCRTRNVDLRVLSDMAGVVSREAVVEDFLGRPAISYRMSGLYPLKRAAKRLTDILVALIMLPLTALPGLIHHLAGGKKPGGQAQVISSDGRTFRMPLPGAETGSRSDLASPRLFWLLLLGHLSLVGPRPVLAGGRESAGGLIEYRPGITGYWRRRDASATDLAGLDLIYARNWNLGLDFQVWFDTLPEQLQGYFPVSLLRKD